jgi:two-component system, LuxR family, response regulator FixJ
MTAAPLIVVIDDHENVRDSMRVLLEAHGFEVKDYPSAVDYLAGNSVGDCIVVDFRMPHMSGLDLQGELTKRGSAIPLIMVTGEGDVPLAVNAMRAGAFDFLEKPVNEDALLDSIRRALVDGQKNHRSDEDRKAASELIGTLTTREREVLNHLVMGKSNKLVAYALGISPRTVETHRARLQEKLKARDLSYLVRISIAAGELH